MKKIYMINYDLNRPGQDYTSLINEIKRSPDWAKYLKSGWLVATTETPAQIYKRLEMWIDGGDEILITEFTSNYFGRLNSEIWNWIKKHGY